MSDILTINYGQAAEILVSRFEFWLERGICLANPPAFFGPPGIGKSSVGNAAHAHILSVVRDRWDDLPALTQEWLANRDGDVPHEILDLSGTPREDIGGVPIPTDPADDGTSAIIMALRKRLIPFCQPGAVGVLVLDDITQAPRGVQVAARQLILQRQMGDFKLAPGVLLFVTGNRKEDGAAASAVPSHFANAITCYEVAPTFDQWVEWFRTSPFFHGSVLGYLRYRPENWYTAPRSAGKLGSFATPRSWESVAQKLAAEPRSLWAAGVQGSVGEGIAVEFMAFLATIDQMVAPAEVIANPRAALPNPEAILDRADKRHAMMSGLGEVGGEMCAQAATSRERSEVTRKYLEAVRWASCGHGDLAAASLAVWLAKGNAMTLVKVGNADPELKPLLDHLSAGR
jgi:hypothetical protein